MPSSQILSTSFRLFVQQFFGDSCAHCSTSYFFKRIGKQHISCAIATKLFSFLKYFLVLKNKHQADVIFKNSLTRVSIGTVTLYSCNYVLKPCHKAFSFWLEMWCYSVLILPLRKPSNFTAMQLFTLSAIM